MLGGAVYVHSAIKDVRTELEAKLIAQKTDLEADILEERTERRRETDRMEKAIEGFASVATAVVAMGKSVEHMTEKLGDNQRLHDRAMDELKHTIRNMDQRIGAIGDAVGTRRRTAAARG